jgi:hypothetical protein
VNTDLYQSLTVALLGAITILLIVAIATLGRLRRTLESNGSMLSRVLDKPAATTIEERSESPTPERTQETQARTAAPADEPVQEASQEVAEAQEPAAVASEATESQPSADAGEEQPEATQAAEEEPQEQPYERDGRWWFRRGDELLVYDEQTGQWLQVEGPSNQTYGGYAPARTSEQGGGVTTEARTSTVAQTEGELVQEGAPEGSHSFWKCPSCGAINGATATSCRMCFAARP